MAIRRIHLANEPGLRQVAKPVNRLDGTLQALIDDMFDTLRAAPGVGLAAPQVGESIRLFVAEWPEDEEDPESVKSYAIINPVIVRARGEGKLRVWEDQHLYYGCQTTVGHLEAVEVDENMIVLMWTPTPNWKHREDPDGVFFCSTTLLSKTFGTVCTGIKLVYDQK